MPKFHNYTFVNESCNYFSLMNKRLIRMMVLMVVRLWLIINQCTNYSFWEKVKPTI